MSLVRHCSLSDKVTVLTASDSLQRSNDLAFPYEQESHFFYLTRIQEPGWLLIIDGIKKKSWLIAPNISDMHLIFDGALDHETAKHLSGVDEIMSDEAGEQLLKQLAGMHDIVYSIDEHPHQEYFSFVVNPAQARLLKKLRVMFKTVKDVRPELDALRAVKSDDEIGVIQRAIYVTLEGFEAVRQSLEQATHEYQLEAILTHAFRSKGAAGHAYDPIVASAGNACTLHYVHNNDQLPENGLVLIDAGARVNGYCADITRTYAIGTPTERQIAVHAAVEKAHHAIIALLGPGKSVKEYQERVDEIMIEALKTLDLYKKPEDYRKYFPHAISHGLGIDVHDSLGAPTHFKPGMVLTVEPGIYIPEEGIGVRIEDDILITDEGAKNLSGALSTSL